MPLILGTNSIKDTTFNVANSLRFNRVSSSSGDSLERTPSSAGNRRTFTFSCWFKLGKLASSTSDFYQLFGQTSLPICILPVGVGLGYDHNTNSHYSLEDISLYSSVNGRLPTW